MEGYYDPYPQVSLERPVALTGFFGAQVEQVAHALSARTGVPANGLQAMTSRSQSPTPCAPRQMATRS